MENASIDLRPPPGTAWRVRHPRPARTTNTAELAWALILACAGTRDRGGGRSARARWQTTVGTDLARQHPRRAGLGRIGRQVARIGQAFGMG